MITEHLVDELKALEKLRHLRRSQVTEYPTLAIVLASSRPNDLLKILSQLEKQSLATFELFLGIHGFELSSPHQDLINQLKARNIPVNIQSFENSSTLGTVLTALANKTNTEFVAKIDDDDIYGPQHLQDLLDAIIVKNADVVGRAMNYIYLEGIDLTVRRLHKIGVSAVELWSDWVCGGTILVKSSIGKQSGWFGEGKSGVDHFLLTSVRKNGGKIWRTYGAGYIYFRSVSNHTYATDYSKYLKSSTEQHVGIWSNKVFGTS